MASFMTGFIPPGGVPIGRVSFNPFPHNGGTVVAVAGQTYVAIGSDTRLSEDHYIFTRETPKVFLMSDFTVLGTTGCWCDALAFQKLLEAKMQKYRYDHNKTMPTEVVANLTSVLLYDRRSKGLPFVINNVVAGLNCDGVKSVRKGECHGLVYSFDGAGHKEHSLYCSVGTASKLIQPLLDNQLAHQNMQEKPYVNIDVDSATAIIEDCFVTAAERNSKTGDSALIYVISSVDDTTLIQKEIQLRID